MAKWLRSVASVVGLESRYQNKKKGVYLKLEASHGNLF